MDGQKTDEERQNPKRRALDDFLSEPMPRRPRGSSINELPSAGATSLQRSPSSGWPIGSSREITSHAGLHQTSRDVELLLLKERLDRESAANLDQLVSRRQRDLLQSLQGDRTTQMYSDQLDAFRASHRDDLRSRLSHGDLMRRSSDPLLDSSAFDDPHVALRGTGLLRTDQTSQSSPSLQDNINSRVFDEDFRRRAYASSHLWQSPRMPPVGPLDEQLFGPASIRGSGLDLSMLPTDDLLQFDPMRSTLPPREQLLFDRQGARQDWYFDNVATGRDRLAARNESLEKLLVEQRRLAGSKKMTERRQFQSSLGNDFPLSDSPDILPQIDTGTDRLLHQSTLSDTANPSTAHARLKALISNIDNNTLQKLVEDCSREVVEASNDESASRNDYDLKVAAEGRRTGTGGIPLVTPTDKNHLTKYQVCIRESLEFFKATAEDVATTVQGRKKKIRLGQVGIRCRFCAHLPLKRRRTGAVHYSNALKYIYQASQNIAAVHFGTRKDGRYIESCCPCMPANVKQILETERLVREESLIGKKYWIKTCTDRGIYEHDGALWLDEDKKVPNETEDTF